MSWRWVVSGSRSVPTASWLMIPGGSAKSPTGGDYRKDSSVFALFKLAAGLCGHAHELDACMGEDGGGVAFRSRLFYF